MAKNGPKWQNVENDNISRFFFIFPKFWFSSLLGDKRAKNGARNGTGIVDHVVKIFGTQV